MFITDGEKHLNFVGDGRNKYWLILFKWVLIELKVAFYRFKEFKTIFEI